MAISVLAMVVLLYVFCQTVLLTYKDQIIVQLDIILLWNSLELWVFFIMQLQIFYVISVTFLVSHLLLFS